jgi:hypothetical protein
MRVEQINLGVRDRMTDRWSLGRPFL